MKNSLLATAVASTLLLASSAHAFTGKIEFTGKLVDKNPYWSIGIPAKSVQDAKGWQSKLADGKAIKGGKTEFSFNKKMDFVQGTMNKMARLKAKGAGYPSLTPIINVAGHTLDFKENEESGSRGLLSFSVPIKGEKYGTKLKDGKLNIKLNDGWIFASDNSIAIDKNIYKRVTGIKNGAPLQLKAFEVMKPIILPLFAKAKTYNKKYLEDSYRSYTGYDLLHDYTGESYLGAFATELSDFKATFDNDAIPEKWTASIPVTISYK